MAQYGTCSNLPTVTAGDVKGILTTRGLECVSENEKSQVDVYLIIYIIVHMLIIGPCNSLALEL